MIAGMFATKSIVHVSLATGAQGILLYILAIPGLCLAFVAWAVATRNLPDGLRRTAMVATILLACGGWALVRTGGFTADLRNDLHWRWTQTPEERLVAPPGALPAAPPPVRPVAGTPAPPPEKPLVGEPRGKSGEKAATLPSDPALQVT